jgi:hypothetical protein
LKKINHIERYKNVLLYWRKIICTWTRKKNWSKHDFSSFKHVIQLFVVLTYYVTNCIKSKICYIETIHIISVGNRNCCLMLEQEVIIKIFLILWWYKIQGGLITDTLKCSEKRILEQFGHTNNKMITCLELCFVWHVEKKHVLIYLQFFCSSCQVTPYLGAWLHPH